jgi:hypothetical protein
VKLSSPILERNLREQVRRELRASPMLWQDYRKHRTRWWKRNRSLRGFFPSIYFVLLLFSVAARSGRPLALLAVIALYASATALFRCANFYTRALRGYDRIVLMTLPVLDDDYLRHESRALFQSWAGAFLVFMLLYGTYTVVYGSLWHALPALLVAAALQALSGFCLGTAVLAYWPKWNTARIFFPLYALMIVCLYLPQDGLQFLWSSTLITPAGWVAHGFAGLVGAVDSAERFWLIPAFVLSAAMPLALRRLRFQLLAQLAPTGDAVEEILAPYSDDGHDQIAIAESAETLPSFPENVPFPQLFERADWAQLGWIQRVVAFCLSNRQKIVAEFMLENDLATWSKKWRTATIITVIGTAATLAAPSFPSWIFFLPMVVAAAMVAPLAGGAWAGFKSTLTSGFVIPVYAGFPLGYAEVSRVMLKTNLIRTLTWAPLALVYAAALAHRVGYSFEYGSSIGLDIVLILMALQPVLVTAHFSGTNDSKQTNWHTLLFFGGGLLLFAIMLAIAITMIVFPTFLVHAAAIVGIFAISLAAWAGYKLLFERGRIDVLSQPRN